MRRTAVATVCAAALIGFALGWWTQGTAPALTAEPRAVLLQDLAITVYAQPKPAVGFRLTDPHGQIFDPRRLTGHWSLLFFGYTHCPDVCPATLSSLAAVMDRLQALFTRDGGIEVFFVSVDPARDSPEVLGPYAAHFHPGFTGITGEPAQLDALLANLGGGYRLVPPQSGEAYAVEHTAAVFVADPQGRVRGYLAHPLAADAVVSRLELVKALYEREKSKDWGG
jgi:protein SCO1/2